MRKRIVFNRKSRLLTNVPRFGILKSSFIIRVSCYFFRKSLMMIIICIFSLRHIFYSFLLKGCRYWTSMIKIAFIPQTKTISMAWEFTDSNLHNYFNGMIRRQKSNEGIPFCVIFCDEIKMQKTIKTKKNFIKKFFFAQYYSLGNNMRWKVVTSWSVKNKCFQNCHLD